MGNRKFSRMAIENLSVDVSDGVGFFQGIVSDVSRFGLGIRDLPKKLNTETEKLSIVLSGKDGHFKMLVRPRWEEMDGLRKNIGVEISNAPWGWTEFVVKHEPIFEDDVWGEVRL